MTKEYIVRILENDECITEGMIVRCRDCKHVMVFKINGHFVGACCTMHEDNNDVTGEDYCSKGARRE